MNPAQKATGQDTWKKKAACSFPRNSRTAVVSKAVGNAEQSSAVRMLFLLTSADAPIEGHHHGLKVGVRRFS